MKLVSNTAPVALSSRSSELSVVSSFRTHAHPLVMRLAIEGVGANHSRCSEKFFNFFRHMMSGTSAKETILCGGQLQYYRLHKEATGSVRSIADGITVGPVVIRGVRNSNKFEMIDLSSDYTATRQQFGNIKLNPHLRSQDTSDLSPWGGLARSQIARQIEQQHQNSSVLHFHPSNGETGEHLLLVVPQNAVTFLTGSNASTAAEAFELLGYQKFSERSIIYQYEHSNKPSEFTVPPFDWMAVRAHGRWQTGVIIGLPDPSTDGPSMVVGIPREDYAETSAKNLLLMLKASDPLFDKFDGPFEDSRLLLRKDGAQTAPYVFYRFSGSPEELGSILENIQRATEQEAVESLQMPKIADGE